jgi:cytochrome c-type protein NapB
MKTLLLTLLIAFSSMLFADESIKSLRGSHDLEGMSQKATVKRMAKDGDPIARNYVQQPPLIPHSIKGYRVNLKSNKCMSCHSWKNYKASGATKISQTHFADRDGNALAEVSSRRYFCQQCHVPQANAKPLVGNDFKPLSAVSDK